MTVEICACEGLNPKCPKCFGSGYINTETVAKSPVREREKNSPGQKAKSTRKSLLPEQIELLSRKELENIAMKIVDALDAKSKKQMQLLNSIPFNSTTFRRDLKDKFKSLEVLETEKQVLRTDLTAVEKEIAAKKFKVHYPFKHYLSNKEIDVASNRQLKGLIREYKKLKSGPE